MKGIRATAAVVIAMLTPSLADACMVKPPPMSEFEIRKESDAIIYGRLSYRIQDYQTVGTITAKTVSKGPRKASFKISHEDMDLACQSWGWEPKRNNRPRDYNGNFYLFANDNGTYSIARYEPKAGR